MGPTWGGARRVLLLSWWARRARRWKRMQNGALHFASAAQKETMRELWPEAQIEAIPRKLRY